MYYHSLTEVEGAVDGNGMSNKAEFTCGEIRAKINLVPSESYIAYRLGYLRSTATSSGNVKDYMAVPTCKATLDARYRYDCFRGKCHGSTCFCFFVAAQIRSNSKSTNSATRHLSLPQAAKA